MEKKEKEAKRYSTLSAKSPKVVRYVIKNEEI
jgi:hypothetical protein